MFVLVLAAGFTFLADARVIDTLAGEEFSRAGISGQVIERPAGISDRDFAVQVMEAEGLTASSGQPMLFSPGEGTMGTAAIVAADGHEVNVKYVAGEPGRAGRICRLRFEPGVGMLPARWNADRWCAAAFGYSLPVEPPPPVRVAP